MPLGFVDSEDILQKHIELENKYCGKEITKTVNGGHHV